ncbi:flagellar biosynthesis protein FlhF [Aestuariibacter sp. A3R04]|uniref:flagellar biosynthesis protein FlhF n=1 Tax=Aestuariibacter sp. A3R04 TaxID=2841571 RepID=UPI001C08DDB0|nr:flagellar biosynthesis protein FlhF [Aestuariibacter sp. A3R04]MBU3022222.1 flagellar biosynthesis protein FlhF [Aestuariibacter sp. A3R04]
MKIRRFFGKDMREALSQVKAELGSDAVIMSNRKVADGIELVAAYDKEPEAKLKLTPRHDTAKPAQPKATPTLSEIIGDDGSDSLRALLEKQTAASAQPQRTSASASQPGTATTSDAMSFDNAPLFSGDAEQIESIFDTPASQMNPEFIAPQNASQSAASGNELDGIKAELASLRSVLQHQVADLMDAKKRQQKPVHSYLMRCLTGMGLSTPLAEQLVHYTPGHYTEREAWVYLLNLLANRVNVSGNDILNQTGVVALVGPTGTGKTTTVAKLAARYAQKYGAEQVAMITIDTYRIAAYEQLATYGKIIGCTTRKAQSSEELSEQLFQLRHKRLILIDTAGFSQRDSRLIKQLGQFNSGQVQPVRKYLVAQANTQYPALQRIIAAYNSVKLDGCIFTKVDECYSLGEVLSIAVEQQLPVSYVTDGQQVPEDIKVADAKSLVSAAAKLYKKYGLDHTKHNHEVNSVQAV